MAQPETVSSPIWNKALKQALERFRSNLDPDDDLDDILERGTLSSSSALMENITAITTKEHVSATSIRRLEPILKALDDMSAVAALSFGAGATMTALLWGSLRVFITLASSASDILQQVLDMLEDLASRLPRFRQFEETAQMDAHMEQSLLDLYTEIICFCARAIKFLRTHPHARLRRHAWSELRHDFSRTMLTINRMANKVESEAELAHMKVNQEQNKEVIEYMRSAQIQDSRSSPCKVSCNVPTGATQLFEGRDELLCKLKDELAPDIREEAIKITAIYGMGGVGKTQIAQEFVRRSTELFGAVMWIHASSATAFHQSFEACAREVAAYRSVNGPTNPNESIAETMKWVNETKSNCLFVFDNVEDANLLRIFWPRFMSGSILLTCRSFGVAQTIGATAHEVLPFDEATSVKFLFKVVQHSKQDAQATAAAREISTLCGGLPLALLQIGSFSALRRMSLSSVLNIYKRSSEAIHFKKSAATDYEQTIGTLWDAPLSQLKGNAAVLQSILSLFQPDAVSETFLQEAASHCKDIQLDFMTDELSLSDAQEILFETNLIRKDIENETLSMHRLIQAATLKRMTREERSLFAMLAVKLLSSSFPDTWTNDVGHQFGYWTRAERTITHAVHFSDVIRDSNFDIDILDRIRYGELLLRCSWYLYERELYDIAWQLIQVCEESLRGHPSLAYASAVDLSGLIKLDLNSPREALPYFERALSTRETLLGPDDVLLGSSLNNIAMAYMEMDELDISLSNHERALDIRKRHSSDRVENSLSNLASLYLRMGKIAEAEESLRLCPTLQPFTDEAFLQTENPRFIGDLVLLARIRAVEGRVDEALRLAAKALNFRQSVHGKRYKTCDSMLLVARLLKLSDRPASAMELLEEAVQVASTLPVGHGYVARAHYWMSTIFESMSDEERSGHHRHAAIEARKEVQAGSLNDSFDESSFEKLTPFMLW